MDIWGIAKELNRRIESSSLADFQKKRAKRLGISVGSYNFFSKHGTKGHYAYHHGGNSELQFNFGYETRGVFRYGIAFSIQRSQSVQDPIGSMRPRILAFNNYLAMHPKCCSAFSIWRYQNGKYYRRSSVREIPLSWIRENTFIFIGKEVPTRNLIFGDKTYSDVISTYEELYPIYLHIESGKPKDIVEKVSKICWNENSWTKPSGLHGKSKDKKSHERKHGYGHEEWLFDFDKLLDGYHYSFLQSIGKYRDKYIGEIYDISLYSTNSSEKNQHYWIADINDVEVLTREQESTAIEQYRRSGWIDELVAHLAAHDVSTNTFMGLVDENDLFNIRFRPENVSWYSSMPVPFKPDEKISHTRYTLLNRESYSPPTELIDELVFSGKTELDIESAGVKRSYNGKGTVQCSQLHRKIQNSLVKYLNGEHPGKLVELEVSYGRGTYIDLVVVLSKTNKHFYEVKTYPSARISIREAVGQLLEYSYYPKKVRAKKLVVVSQAPVTKADRQYILMLNKKFDIPISYIQFDHEHSEILDEC